MHDGRLNPGIVTSYKMDATPGRHTQMGAWTVEGQFAPEGLAPAIEDKLNPSGKGQIHRIVSGHHHAISAAGMCMFAWSNLQPTCVTDSLRHVTGRDFTLDDIRVIGDRIAALRMAFNVREGMRNIDFHLPNRLIGSPPLETGPTAGVSVDVDTQVREYLEAMGWDTETGIPTKETLEELGLGFVVGELHG